MTQIESIRLSDFKGVNELDLDCAQINVITGRNNTGKTSILEATDLLFNPKNIHKYEENIRYLVNSQERSASISTNYVPSQTSINDFSQEERSRSQREMGIKLPKDEDVVNIFIDSVHEIITLNERYPIPSPNHLFGSENINLSSKELKQIVQEQLRDVVSGISPNQILDSGIREDMIILEIDGVDYPVVYFGDYFNDVRANIEERATESIIQRLLDNYHISMNQIDPQRVDSITHRMLAPRFGSLRILGELPSNILSVKFLDDISGERQNFDLDQENAAIKTRKIQDYFVDNNLIPGLVDFSFDKVVFEDPSHPDAYEVPYDYLGDGVKVLSRILWEIFDKEHRNQVLLLEEPENHMHPGYIEQLVTQLIDISRNRGIQLFVTTHNLDLIDAFYSPQVEGERQEFLENSFRLTQLTDSIPKSMDYRRFRKKRDDLNLDPRGV